MNYLLVRPITNRFLNSFKLKLISNNVIGFFYHEDLNQIHFLFYMIICTTVNMKKNDMKCTLVLFLDNSIVCQFGRD